MDKTETVNVRVRAWILIRTDSPHDAARRLFDKLGYAGDDSYVLVRADVVDYHYNLIVPVDAKSWDVLKEVFSTIQNLTEARESVIVQVIAHNPPPPHLSNGYITELEAAEGRIPTEVGRIMHSPGMNPWG